MSEPIRSMIDDVRGLVGEPVAYCLINDMAKAPLPWVVTSGLRDADPAMPGATLITECKFFDEGQRDEAERWARWMTSMGFEIGVLFRAPDPATEAERTKSQGTEG